MVKVYDFNGVFRAFDDDGKYLGSVKAGSVSPVIGKPYYGVADDVDVISDNDVIANAIKAEHEVTDTHCDKCNGDCVDCSHDDMDMDFSDFDGSIDEETGMPQQFIDDITELLHSHDIDFEIRDGELYYATAEDREKGDALLDEFMRSMVDDMLGKVFGLSAEAKSTANLEGIPDGEQDAEIVVRCKDHGNGKLEVDVDIIGHPSVDVLNKMYISLGNAVFQYNNNN